MNIIDSHQHFWQFDPKRDSWIDDTMKILQRDFMPEDLLPQLNENNVVGSIAVQADTSVEETTFLIDLAEKHSFILGVVGWVDFCRNDVGETLAQLSNHDALKGYRHIVQKEPNGFLDREDFRAGIQHLAKYNYTYDILLYPHQLEEAYRFIKTFPNQRFVVDHLAKPYIKAKQVNPWKTHIEQLATFPNVYCKLSGMVTEADWETWEYKDFIPYLDIIINAFGTDRLLFGSDWPVCLLGGSYSKILQLVMTYFDSFSLTEKKAIFYDNTEQFYQLTTT
jgi:L-fuconolactonase